MPLRTCLVAAVSLLLFTAARAAPDTPAASTVKPAATGAAPVQCRCRAPGIGSGGQAGFICDGARSKPQAGLLCDLIHGDGKAAPAGGKIQVQGDARPTPGKGQVQFQCDGAQPRTGAAPCSCPGATPPPIKR